jgi:hypothetical protein
VGAGTCTISADQAGNRNYSAAPQVSRSFKVAKGIQTIVIQPISISAFTPDPIPLVATSSNPITPLANTPIVFTSATPLICAVNNVASTVTLKTTGDCTVNANQAGDANYLAAPVASRSFNPNKAQQTITFPDIPAKTFGDPAFPVSATGGASGLPVVLSSTASTVCTVNANTVTIVGAGSCTITATQAGNDKYNEVILSTSISIAQQKQVITFDVPANKTFGDASFTLTPTASGGSGLPVTFSTLSATCEVTGNSVKIIGAGDCVISANQEGNGNYLAATAVEKKIVIAKAAQTITFAELPVKTLGEAPFGLSATSSAGLPISFDSLTRATCEVAQNTVTIVAAGACELQASQAGDNNYNKALDVTQKFNVSPSNGVISFSPLASSQPKVGEPITFTVTVQPAAGSVAPTGTVTFSDNGATIGSAPLVNGKATFSTSALTNGNHKITATYSGDANNKGGTSDVFGVTVLVQTTVTGGGGSNASTGGGGGGGCALDSLSGSRGGMDPTLPMLLISALIFYNRKYMNKIKCLSGLVAILALAGTPAMALDAGAYVGVSGGKSNTEGDNFDFSERLKREGFSNVTTTLKFNDFAWKVFGGYQFTQYFALEAAYVKLGNATSSASALVGDPAAFADAIARVQPRLAKGASLSVVGTMPVNPKFFTYAKLGAFRWDAEVGASTGTINTLRTTKGNGGVISLGGEAVLGSGWSGRGEIERYVIKPDAANVFSLSLVYRF